MSQASPVRFEFEEVSPVEKRLKVEIAKEEVNAKLEEGFKQLNRQVNLKGFRRGHTPRSVLESMFGKRVGADTAQKLVQESISMIITQSALRIATEPMLEAMPEAKRNQPLVYSARVELLPQIDIKDYEGIEVTQRAAKVTDKQVEDALQQRRENNTEMVPIEGRNVAGPNDTLSIVMNGALGHLTYNDKEMKVDLSKPEQAPLPGLPALLMGMPLDAKDHAIELTLPTEGIVKELAGKTGHFKVTVKSAHEKRLPNLDDEFAKDTGEAETLDALRAKIREDLTTEDAEEARHEMRIALVEALVARNTVPLPQQLVGKLARNLLENPRGRMQIQFRLMAQKSKDNPDAPFTQPTAEELAQAAHAEAVRNLSIEFTMMALADKEKVEVTEADVEKHIAELAKERDKSVARVKAELQREDQGLVQLRGQLRLEKALDVLEAKAKITKAEAAA